MKANTYVITMFKLNAKSLSVIKCNLFSDKV